MSEVPITQDSQSKAPDSEEISLLDLLIILVKHKKLVVGLPLAAALLTAVVSLLFPNIYTATARILPPQQSQSAAIAIFGQLSAQAGALPGLASGALGVKNPTDLYVGMLKSRTVADSLIARFDLKKVYDDELLSDARKTLEKNTVVIGGRDGIVTIEFDDKDPKRAAAIANAYVEELTKLSGVLAVTEASQRRLFFERQLAQAKENLAAAEKTARLNIEKGGLAQVDAQGRSLIEVTARLRAQISVKEVQIGAMRLFAAEGNPELRMAQRELESLKFELSRSEGSSPVAASTSKGDGAGGSGLENLSRLRDMKYYELIYELLARQYELARIDEAKDAALIQVMDVAIEPEKKSKPRRALAVILVGILASIVAVIWAFIQEGLERARNRPDQAGRLERLRDYLRWRSS